MRATVVLSLVVLVRAAYGQPSEAERLYTVGQDAYDDQRYDDALAAWDQSYALSKLPGLQFNLAQAYRLRARPGDCARATAHFRTFLALDRASPKRAVAESFLAELGACAPAEPLVAPRASLDEPHRSEARGRSKQLGGYALFGGGVAAALTGAYFGNRASVLGNEVTAACKVGCNWSVQSAKQAEGLRDETTQWILYGVGAAAVVTGGVLWALGAHERSSSIAIAPRAGGATVSWSGAW
jgi:hypothetical protein